MTNILDCTFRDGGYYTDWDFNDEVIKSYISGMNKLPIDYIELGYRNNPENNYMKSHFHRGISEILVPRRGV